MPVIICFTRFQKVEIYFSKKKSFLGVTTSRIQQLGEKKKSLNKDKRSYVVAVFYLPQRFKFGVFKTFLKYFKQVFFM